MPLIRDPGLSAQADQARQTYETARAALAGSTGDRDLEAAAPIVLPPEVDAARRTFLFELRAAGGPEMTLEVVQYFRHVNSELVDSRSTDQDPGPNPVQLSQTITVNSPDGAYIDVQQWMARVVPAAAAGQAPSGPAEPAP